MKIMLRPFFGFLALCISLFVVTGCGKKTDAAVDVRPLEKNFSTAEPAIKLVVDKAIADVKSQNYGAVVVELSQLATNEKLTSEQQKALKEVLGEAQKIVVANAPKNVDQMPMAMPK